MPINASIPLQVRGPDPNGFTNALLQGMKMRQYQNEGDAAARKEEDAMAQRNALSAYLSGDQSAESLRALGAASPEGYLAMAQSKREADLNVAKTGKANAEGAKANLGAVREGIDAISGNPTRENITMVADWLDTQKVPTTILRKQLESTPDQALPGLVQGWGMKVKEQEDLLLRTRNVDSQIAYRDSMQGKPMVIQTPGGAFSYDPQNPEGTVARMDTGPGSAEVAEAAAEEKRAAALEKWNQPNPQTVAKVRDKLAAIELIEKQLDNVADKFEGSRNPDGTRKRDGVRNTYSAGPGADYLPTPEGQAFDASVAALSPFVRQLTRTPGEGSMSDYESRLVADGLPSRGKYENVTAQQIQQWRDTIKQLKSGYTGMLPTVVPGAAAPVGPGQGQGSSTLTPTEEPAYRYYKNRHGLSDAGAFALSRNITTESGHRTDVKGDGGKARGLAQWHPDRWAKLEKWADEQGLDPNSKQAQMDYILEEGKSYPGFESLKSNDPKAIRAFIKAFEGYGIEGARFSGLEERASQAGGPGGSRSPATQPAGSKEFDSMPKPGEYAGKRIQTPAGVVYRSNGAEWIRE